LKTGQSLLSGQSPGALTHGLVIGVQLAVLCLLFAQTLAFDYVYFDDAEYVLENPAVRAGLTLEGIRWAFTSFYMSNWHPLTWLSHMLDVSLFGVDPGWAHIHNVALHGINSLLVYVLLLKLSGSWGKAGVLSLVFLVHPLHVESVAWIAERKDLLCALFFLLGLILYDSYRASPGKLRYAGILLAFALSLLAKPMAVTFPVVLLILDFFVYRNCFQAYRDAGPGGKVDYFRALVEKLPFIALALGSSIVTIAAQNAGNSMAYLEAHSLISRWNTATTAYLMYLKQFVLPVDLVAFYPVITSSSASFLLIPSAILGALLVLALMVAPQYPLIMAGLSWYLMTLLPVIGLVQVGSQAHADRYMYLPSVGVLLACVYLLPSRHSKRFQLGIVISSLFLVYLTVICYWQVGYWRNQHVLFSRVLAFSGPTYLAHLHLAEDYIRRAMLTEAREHALSAMKLRPDIADSYQAIGNIALAEKKFKEAEKYYRITLSKGQVQANVVNNLGITLAEQGDIPAAIKAFNKALGIEPDMAEAQKNLRTYTAKKQRKDAQ
jgi:protein O-mannosyl-transferase